MKILQINSVYGYASTGRIVQNLHHAVTETGHDSYVIYGRGNNTKEKNVFKIGNIFEQAIDLAGTRLLNKHAQFNYRITDLIIKKIKSINPDIINLHNIHGYYVNFFKLISSFKKLNIKVVWLLHDSWFIFGSPATMGGLEYDWEGERNFRKMKSISNEYPKHLKCSAKRSISNYEIKKEILSESRFILVSLSNRLNSVIKNLYLKNSKIITIYNGIDTEKFEPNDIHEQSKHINILGVANIWESYKSLKYFERLAGDLDVTYFITLVGALHDKEQLHPRIKHVERTQPINELVEYYTQADIFVNPTVYDNFPTVNIEAQACGTLVITFDTGGSRESIVEGKTGKIISKEEYDVLLKEIIEFPKKSKNIEKNLRDNSLKFYLNNMLTNYLKLYTEILE